MGKQAQSIDPTERICDDGETPSRCFKLPRAVDHFIDVLIEEAETEGERKGLPRQELVAALIAATKADGPKLRKCLESYRQMKNRDLLGNTTTLAAHSPGRRRS